jgi:hypothetical protein
MLFLLNDRMLRLDAVELAPPMQADQFRKLSLDFVRELGREVFAEHPLLPASYPRRAARLAALIACKAPRINAALFVAPGFGCPTEMVTCRFAEVSFDLMAWLYEQQQSGGLTNLVADRQVWRRLAA